MSRGSNTLRISFAPLEQNPFPNIQSTIQLPSMTLQHWLGGIGSELGPGYVGDSMGIEEGEWEEDGEDSDKKEHLTCVLGQETTPGINHIIEQL